MAALKKTGLRIHGLKSNKTVRRAIIKFSRWLRNEYEFPIRLNVYLIEKEYLIAKDKTPCVSSMWVPDNRDLYCPYIRIAVGDFKKQKAERGRDDALAPYLCELINWIIVYHKWVKTDEVDESKDYKTGKKSQSIIYRYAETAKHP